MKATSFSNLLPFSYMSPSNPCRRVICPASARKFGFTLVEMLTVVAVISVLIAVTVPAVSTIGGSGSVATGGNMVSELVSLARQEAMSKNTMTALVLLGHQGTTNDFRSLAVMSYSSTQGWKQLSRWETLPSAIIVDPDPSASSFLANSPMTLPFLKDSAGGDSPVYYKGKQVKSGPAYYARTFLPSGGLQNSEQSAQLRMLEGSILPDGSAQRRHPANYYLVSIVGSNGFPKVDRP